MSKYYFRERDCVECGESFNAKFLMGVRQPVTTKCNECRRADRDDRIERVLEANPDVWYRPDSDDYEIAVYKPNGDRRYYRHDLHAVQRIESWYESDS